MNLAGVFEFVVLWGHDQVMIVVNLLAPENEDIRNQRYFSMLFKEGICRHLGPFFLPFEQRRSEKQASFSYDYRYNLFPPTTSQRLD